jgi:hypothetical protein
MNVWPREGNRSEAEHELKHETGWRMLEIGNQISEAGEQRTERKF